MTLAQWLARLEAAHPVAIDLGLERVRRVYDAMQLRLAASTIVVGGTNGKGSTCAMLEAILLAAGYRVACYTSPHLVDFNERLRFDGEPVADAALVAAFEAVERARGATSLTYFEFTTLAALALIAERAPDAAVLEIGLGGRLDAVNVVDADCAIVTSIDIDHVGYLGDTRESIGWEKAHIYRPGRPAICADPAPPARLLEHAGAIGADLWLAGRDFVCSGDRQQWSYRGRRARRNSLAYPAIRGANQLLNASAALAALEALAERLPVTQQAVREGLAAVSLPGRFQVLPGRPTVVLDVAHNPHAAAHLARNLDAMGYHRLTYAVFGAMADKDIDAIVAAMRPLVDHWIVTDLPGARAATASTLAARLRAAGIDREPEHSVSEAASPRAALAMARERADEGDRIVVFGSFLTVGDILASRRSR